MLQWPLGPMVIGVGASGGVAMGLWGCALSFVGDNAHSQWSMWPNGYRSGANMGVLLWVWGAA